ncbi:integrase [Clostridiales bacterium COT073_COT-073]|nr:integrase [Clostridiales bacterium COT073_COT-073]
MSDYHEKQNEQNTKHLRELLVDLPPLAGQFFRGIETTTASRTRIAYAYDLKIFFSFLIEEVSFLKGKKITDLTLRDIDALDVDDLERYVEYLNYYETDGTISHSNKEKGKSRKIASLRSFYNYFYKKQKIKNNPALLIDMPKIHDHHITRLEVDEVAKLLDEAETGEKLTKNQQYWHEHTKERDVALLTLLLGTGIRVSECVGLNISDLDFSVNGMKIIRKGGNEVVLYFGEEVKDALLLYLEKRNKILALSGHENALFLSMQNKRISVRSVQNLVKKYSGLVTKLKNISPHKLRSTYGTNLYRETGDIYLVADVLGHKDVNTTKKHYAELEDERRRMAAKAVKLRKE